MDAFIIILTGSLVAVSCGLLGSFLILRKMSMVGDAISHSVLPGIVIAFFPRRIIAVCLDVSGCRSSGTPHNFPY